VAQGAAEAKLLGSDPDPAGGRVVTYNGWPLYTWAGDTKPGEATGQAINNSGGLWYALSPSGQVISIVPAVASGQGTATNPTTTSPTGTTPSLVNNGCPAGETIQTSGATDNDGDENGAPSDNDGCI
jgi:hypothetical protein